MGDVRLGRYRLGRRLAMGGMAEVFCATITGAEGFEKPVAIKRILPHLCEDEEFVEMFREEALMASRLSHANIAQVLDFTVVDGRPLLVMEWVNGKDLRRAQRAANEKGLPLSVAGATHLAREVSRALRHAHEAPGTDGRPMGLVHRDVSPQNILLSFAGEVKLADFGIAKAACRSFHTSAGVVKGKSGYMSPEQARGAPLDGRSDVFALGIVLWESLTGRRLFAGASDAEIIWAILHQATAAPSQIRAEVPPALDALVLRALAKDPEDRQAGAAELEGELTDVILRHARDARDLDLAAWMRSLFGDAMDGGPSGRGTGVRTAARVDVAVATRPGPRPGPEESPARTRSDAGGYEEPAGEPAHLLAEPLAAGPGYGGRSPERVDATAALATAAAPARKPTPTRALLLLGAPALALALAATLLLGSERDASAEGGAKTLTHAPGAVAAPLPETVDPSGAPASPASTASGEPKARPPAGEHSEPEASPPAVAGAALERAPRTEGIGEAETRGAEAIAGAERARGAPNGSTGTAPSPATPPRETARVTSTRARVASEGGSAASASRGTRSRSPDVSPEPLSASEPPEPAPLIPTGVAMILPALPSGEEAAREGSATGRVVPAGARLQARLVSGVDTSAGTSAEARVVRSYVSGDEVLIPRGALLTGAAVARGGRVALEFDALRRPGERARELRASARGGDGLPGILALEGLTGRADGRDRASGLTLPPGTGMEVVLAEPLSLSTDASPR